MVIVKTPKTLVKKNKIHKFDLITNQQCESINILGNNINTSGIHELASKNVEKCNKVLEKLRAIDRAIECSANRNFESVSDVMIQKKINRTKGYYLTGLDSENGIYIH